jgi:hypothetical protein
VSRAWGDSLLAGGHSLAAAARSASTNACSWRTRPAGIVTSPPRRRSQHARPSQPPVTTHRMRRARLSSRVGQGHPPPFLVKTSHSDVRLGDIEHRVPRHQRGRMAVWAEAKVNKVEHRRRAGNLLKNESVTPGCGLQVGRFDWHGANLLGAERDEFQQARAQVSEVPVRMPCRRHPLVHLRHIDAGPRQVLVGERAQHLPRRLPPLTAKTKRPRATTAPLASWAMILAASAATAVASANTRISMIVRLARPHCREGERPREP